MEYKRDWNEEIFSPENFDIERDYFESGNDYLGKSRKFLFREHAEKDFDFAVKLFFFGILRCICIENKRRFLIQPLKYSVLVGRL